MEKTIHSTKYETGVCVCDGIKYPYDFNGDRIGYITNYIHVIFGEHCGWCGASPTHHGSYSNDPRTWKEKVPTKISKIARTQTKV